MMVISSDGRFFNACHLWRSQIGFSTAEKVVKKFNAELMHQVQVKLKKHNELCLTKNGNHINDVIDLYSN